MNKTLKVILIVLGVIVGIFIIGIALSSFASHSSEKLSQKIDVSVVRTDKADSVSDVTYSITNTSEKTLKLNSIDINMKAFEQAELVNVNEQRTDEYTTFGMRAFEFMKKIEPGETASIVFTFKRRTPTTQFIDTDICMSQGGICMGRSFDL
ncbi:MAG TPA: hypothetical protein VGE63_02555 [Candidatus Paceibacterota bacterium]